MVARPFEFDNSTKRLFISVKYSVTETSSFFTYNNALPLPIDNKGHRGRVVKEKNVEQEKKLRENIFKENPRRFCRRGFWPNAYGVFFSEMIHQFAPSDWIVTA